LHDTRETCRRQPHIWYLRRTSEPTDIRRMNTRAA
jgi:hypothetical protein